MNAPKVSRREQAGWSTREHVRRVAVTAFDATEQQNPVEGFDGLSRPVLDDPLAGVRAGRLVADVAAAALRDSALRARGMGRGWDDVGEALGLPDACDMTRAVAAWVWLVEHRPLRPGPQLVGWPSSAVWTCSTCRARVRDTGPFAAHPDDRETGHLDDCARRAAALEAWRRDERSKKGSSDA